jgi:hypothetical protein
MVLLGAARPNNLTARQVPETIISRETANISQICQFGWFNWVMYHDPAEFPDNKAILGRYLVGPAVDVGSMLTAKILMPNGQYVCRSTLRHLNNDERISEVHKAQRLTFDQAINDKLGPKASPLDFDEQDSTPKHMHCGEDADSIDSDHGNLEITPVIGDNYFGAEILLPRGGVLLKGQVTRHKRDADGNPIGQSHDSSALDTQSYIVEFDNNYQTELTANLIAESMYAQCDPDVNQYLLLAEIADHRSMDNSVKLHDQKFVRANGRTYLRRLTAGWQLCCQWIDGSTSWESLNDLKNSHPVETVEYAKTDED